MNPLLFFAVILAVVCTTARCDDLYPKCLGVELTARATGGQEKLLGTASSQQANTLLINCLAFQVTSVSPKGVCDIPHQTSFPFRLFVRARGTLNTSSPYVDEFDVKDVVGGSINRLTITAPTASTFELYFKNEHTSSDCMLSIRAIFTTELKNPSNPATAPVLPSIVNMDPPTAFANSPVYFVAKHSSSTSVDTETLHLVPIERKCSDLPRTNLTRVKDADIISKYTLRFGALANRFSVWHSPTPATDNYKICAVVGMVPYEVALLTVFGGNPSYFTIIFGADKKGRIYVNTPIVMQFNGYSLDTRPNHDMAKLVDEDATCDGGDPAGGVPLGTDLGPADNWGPDTTFATWGFTITRDGGFKVCYRRHGGTWIEVPSFDDLPPGAVVLPTTTPAPVPQPTHPKTHDRCPLAKPRAEKPKFAMNVLKLVFKVKKVPSFFRSILSEVLCVSPSAISYERVTVNKDGMAVLYMDIFCAEGVCGSQDRKSFLLEVAAASKDGTISGYPTDQVSGYADLSIDTIEEVSSRGILTFSDPGSTVSKKTSILFIVGCVTVVVLAAIGAFVFIQYRKNQHHFIQFGIDDDDDVEIPDDSNAPVRQADAI